MKLPDKREVGSSTLPRPMNQNLLPRLRLGCRRGFLHPVRIRTAVDSCRRFAAEASPHGGARDSLAHSSWYQISLLVYRHHRQRALQTFEVAKICPGDGGLSSLVVARRFREWSSGSRLGDEFREKEGAAWLKAALASRLVSTVAASGPLLRSKPESHPSSSRSV